MQFIIKCLFLELISLNKVIMLQLQFFQMNVNMLTLIRPDNHVRRKTVWTLTFFSKLFYFTHTKFIKIFFFRKFNKMIIALTMQELMKQSYGGPGRKFGRIIPPRIGGTPRPRIFTAKRM